MCWAISSQLLTITQPWCNQRESWSETMKQLCRNVSPVSRPAIFWPIVPPSRMMTPESRTDMRRFHGCSQEAVMRPLTLCPADISGCTLWAEAPTAQLMAPGPAQHEHVCQEWSAEPRLWARLPSHFSFRRHRDSSLLRRQMENGSPRFRAILARSISIQCSCLDSSECVAPGTDTL